MSELPQQMSPAVIQQLSKAMLAPGVTPDFQHPNQRLVPHSQLLQVSVAPQQHVLSAAVPVSDTVPMAEIQTPAGAQRLKEMAELPGRLAMMAPHDYLAPSKQFAGLQTSKGEAVLDLREVQISPAVADIQEYQKAAEKYRSETHDFATFAKQYEASEGTYHQERMQSHFAQGPSRTFLMQTGSSLGSTSSISSSGLNSSLAARERAVANKEQSETIAETSLAQEAAKLAQEERIIALERTQLAAQAAALSQEQKQARSFQTQLVEQQEKVWSMLKRQPKEPGVPVGLSPGATRAEISQRPLALMQATALERVVQMHSQPSPMASSFSPEVQFVQPPVFVSQMLEPKQLRSEAVPVIVPKPASASQPAIVNKAPGVMHAVQPSMAMLTIGTLMTEKPNAFLAPKPIKASPVLAQIAATAAATAAVMHQQSQTASEAAFAQSRVGTKAASGASDLHVVTAANVIVDDANDNDDDAKPASTDVPATGGGQGVLNANEDSAATAADDSVGQNADNDDLMPLSR
jgi:hypothetical protein